MSSTEPPRTSGRSIADEPAEAGDAEVQQLVEHLFRREWARLTASLVRVFGVGNLELVEEVVQDALVAALRHWRYRGVPGNPSAWLAQVARHRGIDVLRRHSLLRSREQDIARWARRDPDVPADEACGEALDEQLQLMFACCHPRLPPEARIALTLRSIGGFRPAEIARAFLVEPQAIAQRLVRAKRRIREEPIQLQVPHGMELKRRLDSVLTTLYLLFNEGYAAHGGDSLIRADLVAEACRLASLLLEHPATGDPAVHALLALMLFQSARLPARTDAGGAILLLEEQDRTLWDRAQIARGFHHLQQSAAGERLTAYHLEAAIAACHSRAQRFADTDWQEILSHYDLLRRIKPSPVVDLNRAVALSMAAGWKAGLRALDSIAAEGRLDRYHLLAAARGEILVRAGRHGAAVDEFRKALGLACSEPEQALLRRKLAGAEALAAPAAPDEGVNHVF